MVNILKNLSQKLKRSKSSAKETLEHESTQSRPQTAYPSTTRPVTAQNNHITWDIPQTGEYRPRVYTETKPTHRSSQSLHVPSKHSEKALPPLPNLKQKPEFSSRSGNSGNSNSFESYADFEEVLAAQRQQKRWTKELLSDGEWAADTLEHAGIPASSVPRPQSSVESVQPTPVFRTNTGLQRRKAQRQPTDERKEIRAEELAQAKADYESSRRGKSRWI